MSVFVDFDRLETRDSNQCIENRWFDYFTQSGSHCIHVEVEILHAGLLAVGIVAVFGYGQHRVDGPVGCDDGKPVVALEIEDVHQCVGLRFAVAGDGDRDALAPGAADCTRMQSAGRRFVDDGDALLREGQRFFVTARGS